MGGEYPNIRLSCRHTQTQTPTQTDTNTDTPANHLISDSDRVLRCVGIAHFEALTWVVIARSMIWYCDLGFLFWLTFADWVHLGAMLCKIAEWFALAMPYINQLYTVMAIFLRYIMYSIWWMWRPIHKKNVLYLKDEFQWVIQQNCIIIVIVVQKPYLWLSQCTGHNCIYRQTHIHTHFWDWVVRSNRIAQNRTQSSNFPA